MWTTRSELHIRAVIFCASNWVIEMASELPHQTYNTLQKGLGVRGTAVKGCDLGQIQSSRTTLGSQ